MPLYQKRKVELSERLKFSVGRGASQGSFFRLLAAGCLLLTVGLSLNAARLLWKSNDHAGEPKVLGATDNTKPVEETQSIQFVEYKVQKGDTLFNLAQRYGISWATLATLNNLDAPFTLKAGQTLRIPKN